MSEPTSNLENASAGFRFRDTTRAPFETTVRLRFDRLGGAVTAESADISMEGMFVKTQEPRPVGTLVQFEFDVEDPDGSSATNVVQGLGDVVWVRAQGGPTKPAGMGIQFRYVDAQSREHVYRIVSSFIRQISGNSDQSVPGDFGSAPQGPHSLRGEEAMADFEGGVQSSLLDGEQGGAAVGIVPPEPAEQYGFDESSPPKVPPLAPPPPPQAPTSPGAFGTLLDSSPHAPEPGPAGASGGAAGTALPVSGSISRSLVGPSIGSTAEDALEANLPDHEPAAAPALGGGLHDEERGSDPGLLAADRVDEPAEQSAPLLGKELWEDDLAAGSSLGRVEPYEPTGSMENDLYGAGSAASGSGSRRLVGLLVLLGLLALIWFLRPWSWLEGNQDDESPSAGAAQQVAEEPAEQSSDVSRADDAETASLGTAEASAATTSIDDAISEPSAPEPAPTTETPSASFVRRDGSSLASRAKRGNRVIEELAAADFADRTQVRVATSVPLAPGEYSHLSLSNPPRFVLKLQRVESDYRPRVRSQRFGSVRTGMHVNEGTREIHIVFDMNVAGFAADVRLDQGELLITFR